MEWNYYRMVEIMVILDYFECILTKLKAYLTRSSSFLSWERIILWGRENLTPSASSVPISGVDII